jgi:hypothetical protein
LRRDLRCGIRVDRLSFTFPQVVMVLVSRALLALLLLACASTVFGQAGSVPVENPANGSRADAAPSWSSPEPWRTDRFYFQTSIATVHFNPDPDHDNSQNLIYGEWRLPHYALGGQWLVGAAAFDNSFGQSSQFVFGGMLWRPVEKHPELYVKVAAGVLHGYKDEFRNKIPYNSSGYAPGIVPAVGYCYNHICGEMILFGAAGMLWTVGVTLP